MADDQKFGNIIYEGLGDIEAEKRDQQTLYQNLQKSNPSWKKRAGIGCIVVTVIALIQIMTTVLILKIGYDQNSDFRSHMVTEFGNLKNHTPAHSDERLEQQLQKVQNENREMQQNLSTLLNNERSLEQQLERMRSKNREMQSNLSELHNNVSGCGVAFYALKTASGNIGANIVKFENVVLNKGDGYQPSTGIFTAPATGLYVFSATIVTIEKVATAADIFINFESVGKIFADAREARRAMDDSATTTVTVELNSGDKVYVRIHHNWGSYVDGGNWSSFTGYQIGC